MIYCIGDSFTFGDELPDLAIHQEYPASEFAWPALLGNLTNLPVTNGGRSGCGNSRIIKRAIDATLDKTYDIIIVAWSNPDRCEYIDQQGIYNDWPGRNPRGLTPSRMDWHKKLEETVTDEYYSWSHRRWLRDVLLLQSFFKLHEQKYLMLQSHQSQWHNRVFLEKNSHLADHIDTKYFLGWPYDGIVEWVVGCPEGPRGHPLEDGHKIVADKIYEHIRHLGWIS